MTTLATLSVKLIADASKFRSEMERAEKQTGGFLGSIGRNVQAVGNMALVGLGALASAAGIAGAALAKLAVEAATVEGLRMAFEGLAESAGASADDLLAALEKGSAGMIAQRDLMKSYNTAAQLVSQDFASTLPDAMLYLSKVAASTGQDLDFLLDSYVRGVGRLSPMILDNLAVQVDLTEAYDAYAKKIGKATDALTKQEQQMAVAEATLAKLAESTAAMPDVTETAAAKMARFKATLQNVKDTIGMALLPTVSSLMDSLGKVAERVLPIVVEALEKYVVPVFEKGARFIELFITALEDGMTPVQAFKAALSMIGLGDVAAAIGKVQRKLGELWAVVGPFVTKVLEWIGKNIKLEDVLLALGAAIATVVVPAIWSVISAAAPVVGVFLGLVGLFALIRSAWENDLLGIRSFLEGLWSWLTIEGPVALENLRAWFDDIWGRIAPIVGEAIATIQGKLTELQPIWDQVMGGGQGLIDWVVSNWPMIQETITQVMTVVADIIVQMVEYYVPLIVEGFTTVVDWIVTNWPAIRATAEEVFNAVITVLNNVWAFIEGSVIPVLATLADTLISLVGTAITNLSEIWQGVLLPILQIVWDYIQTAVIPLFQRVAEVAVAVVGTAINILATYWQTILWPALQIVWSFIQGSIIPLFNALANLTKAVLMKAVELLTAAWENKLKPALEHVWQVVDTKIMPVFRTAVSVINTSVKPVLEKMANVVLPALKRAFDDVASAVKWVIDKINDLASKISNMEIPDWLQPGSPPPLYYALMDIGKAMDMVSSRRMPAFAMGMASIEPYGEGMMDVSAGVMGGVTRAANGQQQAQGHGKPTVVLYGPVHVHGVQDAQGLIEELQELAG